MVTLLFAIIFEMGEATVRAFVWDVVAMCVELMLFRWHVIDMAYLKMGKIHVNIFGPTCNNRLWTRLAHTNYIVASTSYARPA